jgi:hypothetical protein
MICWPETRYPIRLYESSACKEGRASVSALVPETWLAKDSITLVAGDSKANVIASSEPLSRSMGTDEYAKSQGDLYEAEFPGYDEISCEPKLVFGGQDGVVRRFRWLPPDGDAVMQIQHYYADGRRGYIATATVPAELFSAREVELVDILDGLCISTTSDVSTPTVSSYEASLNEDLERLRLRGPASAERPASSEDMDLGR